MRIFQSSLPGSDDLNVIIWDWERSRKLVQYNTGHRANVFQSKIFPGDLLISSCSRDGQVRLAELSVTGALRSTKKLAQHKGPAHKMSLIPESQYCLLSAGRMDRFSWWTSGSRNLIRYFFSRMTRRRR